MATYKYKCLKCENIFDIKATLQEKEEKGKNFFCPKCGVREIKQNFSPVNFIKNIFMSENSSGCCGGEDTCKPDKNNSKECGDKKGGSSCCG